MTLDRFEELAAALRETLNLPEWRAVRPNAGLGLLHVELIGEPVADVTQCGHQIIVTPRFIQWLEREGVTGWQAFPVLPQGRRKQRLAELGLVHLLVTGRGGMARGKNGPKRCERCGCTKWCPWWDYELDESAWDGSPIFAFEYDYEHAFVTEDLRYAMQRAGFSTVRFQPVPCLPPPAARRPGDP
ncbi:MAG: hypothetical protein HYU66_03650 [Armatimonadetes bacterium]|nr:hypothetical protein [Armatimonadota bacterium]